MKPIDKLTELDYTEVFSRSDKQDFELGMFCIFSDNGHFWHTGTLIGIEETENGKLYRAENSLQYKHCHGLRIECAITYLQQVIIKSGTDIASYYYGYIVGEHNDFWLIYNRNGMHLAPKSDVAFVDEIKF